ncbi:MAG: ABC transporter permease subunit [Sandaracinus sp.]|nr:ABC transporter permease subunit [Sandaracinus sp.]MCB9634271.1 ABC transporter permease subunit [Sandaracinus sp.]
MSKAAQSPASVGQPPAPGFVQGVGVIFRMQIRRLVRGRKLRLAVVATSLVVFSVVAARYASQRDGVGAERAQELAEDAMQNGLGWGFFKLLCFLLPFLFTSGAIAEEVEGRTFAFVSSRPVSRPAIAVGKWAAGAVLSVALLAGSAILLHLVALATDPAALVEGFPKTLKAVAALSLLGVCYSAMCLLWGALVPEAAGVVAGLYLGVVEWILGFAPGSVRFISMNYLARQMAGQEPGGLFPEIAPVVDGVVAAGAIGGVTLLFLFFAILVVSTSELRIGTA